MTVRPKQLKVGIIGLGVGEAHISAYQAHPECSVVTLCDLNQEKFHLVKDKYSEMRFTQDEKDILKDPDIDIVSIASFDNDHYKQIVSAIEQDKHIFVEKPLCLKEEHARHIKKLLDEKSHLKISSNLILRKCPRFIALKKKITDGDFGELFSIEGDYNYGRLHKLTEGWRGKLDSYSVVLGGGVHIIDLLLWLSNDEIIKVGGFGNNISSKGSQFKFNDMVSCVLKFNRGLVGKMSVNFGCVQPHFHNLMVYGTKATFINTKDYGKVYTSRDTTDEFMKMVEPYPGVHKGDLIYDFVNAVINDNEPQVSKDEIYKTMSVCFSIDKSINNGFVTVNYI